MATSTIKYSDIKSSLVVAGSSISANNLYVYRCGRVVLLAGYITNSSDVGMFASFFTIPEGFRPCADVSISPISQDTTAWLFITSVDGVCSPQNVNLTSGTRYFTAMWIA